MSKAGIGHTQLSYLQAELLTHPRSPLVERKLGELLAHICTMVFQGDFWEDYFNQFLNKPQLFLQAPRDQQMVPAEQAPESLKSRSVFLQGPN